MGWLDDAITLGGTISGSVLGGYYGGPGGAAAGGAAGTASGRLIGGWIDPSDNGASDEARKLAAMYDAIQYQDPMSDPAYAKEMGQLQDYGSGKLTPADKARELEALTQAGQFARGREGAIAQAEASKGQGDDPGMKSVLQAESAQGAATRLNSADVQTAGMASNRALAANEEFLRQMSMNKSMQNQFALAKAGGQSQSGLAYLNFLGAQDAARRTSFDSLVGGMGKAGLAYKFGTDQAPAGSDGGYTPTDSFAGGGSPASINLAGENGSPIPFSSLPGEGASAFTSFLNGGMPVDQTQPGSAPSSEAITADEAATRKRTGVQIPRWQ